MSNQKKYQPANLRPPDPLVPTFTSTTVPTPTSVLQDLHDPEYEVDPTPTPTLPHGMQTWPAHSHAQILLLPVLLLLLLLPPPPPALPLPLPHYLPLTPLLLYLCYCLCCRHGYCCCRCYPRLWHRRWDRGAEHTERDFRYLDMAQRFKVAVFQGRELSTIRSGRGVYIGG